MEPFIPGVLRRSDVGHFGPVDWFPQRGAASCFVNIEQASPDGAVVF